jgi:hypothetical protein
VEVRFCELHISIPLKSISHADQPDMQAKTHTARFDFMGALVILAHLPALRIGL